MLHPYKGVMPRIAPDVFIAPGAHVIGDVEIGPGSSVWFNAVIRGDVEPIRIGARSNIQDGTVIHVSDGLCPAIIGDDVLIGHMALLHGCTLEDRCMVSMGATVMDEAVVETGAMVAAGALVTPRKRILAGQLWGGSPAAYMRDLNAAEKAFMVEGPLHYGELAGAYLKER